MTVSIVAACWLTYWGITMPCNLVGGPAPGPVASVQQFLQSIDWQQFKPRIEVTATANITDASLLPVLDRLFSTEAEAVIFRFDVPHRTTATQGAVFCEAGPAMAFFDSLPPGAAVGSVAWRFRAAECTGCYRLVLFGADGSIVEQRQACGQSEVRF